MVVQAEINGTENSSASVSRPPAHTPGLLHLQQQISNPVPGAPGASEHVPRSKKTPAKVRCAKSRCNAPLGSRSVKDKVEKVDKGKAVQLRLVDTRVMLQNGVLGDAVERILRKTLPVYTLTYVDGMI